MLNPVAPSRTAIPFDAARLDRLMEEAGIDVLVATSKHNVQYLPGGHRAFFFEYMDAMGLSRYLPVFVYAKGAPDKAAYFGHRLESFQTANDPLWTPGAGQFVGLGRHHRKAVDAHPQGRHRRAASAPSSRSCRSTPAGAARRVPRQQDLRRAVRARAAARDQDAGGAREAQGRLRGGDRLDAGGDRRATGRARPRRELTEALRREETNRGLTFEYCLITAGTSLNRAPSEQRWDEGDILSLDSGGNYHGYIGDLCRMAIQGEPDARTRGPARRDRGDPARRDEADPGRRRWAARSTRPPKPLLAQVEAPQPHALPRPWHGAGQPRGAAAHQQRAGAL